MINPFLLQIAGVLVSFLIMGIYCFHTYKAESAAAISQKVQAGISAGEKIIGLLNFNSTSSILTRITAMAKNIGPFLGALGPIVSLITLFLPKGESPVMTEMKRQFAIVDANFDKVFNRFNEIRNLIQETSMMNQYSRYESNILALSRRLKHFLSASSDNMEEYKATFMESYRSTYGNAAFIIWTGMMGQGTTFKYDIPLQAMKFTNNHRRRVQDIMHGGLNLILQGVKIHLIYLQLANRTSSHETEKIEWENKIRSLLERMKNIDMTVESRFIEQATTDAVKKMAEFNGKSNAALADNVYTMLKDKFDWRLWFVVVYDALHGADKHWVWYCGGFVKFRHHGKNMVVASNGKDKPALDASCAESGLAYVKTRFTTVREIALNNYSYKVDARLVVDRYFPPEYKDCMAPGHGAILTSGNAQFRGPQGRFVDKDNGSYKLYVFQ